MSLAIIVPVYQDDENLLRLLKSLSTWEAITAAAGVDLQVVIADGAGDKTTAALAEEYNCGYVSAERGRGNQIDAAIRMTLAKWYWVIHADSTLDDGHVAEILELVNIGAPVWGRFDIRIDELPWLAWFMNARSRLTSICTGDQAMFFHSELLARIGGFPAQPLMEDIELSKRMKTACGSYFNAPRVAVATSARRWQARGVLKTILSMWLTRIRYWLGADPYVLFDAYYGSAND